MTTTATAAGEARRDQMERNANPRPTKRVIVTIFHDNDGECRVEPREAWVRPGGTVEFRSRVGPLTVFVPTPTRAGRLFPRISAPLFPVPARGIPVKFVFIRPVVFMGSLLGVCYRKKGLNFFS